MYLSQLESYEDDKYSSYGGSCLQRAENIVGKGKNAVDQHFLLFPQCFQKPLSVGLLKLGDVVTDTVKFILAIQVLQQSISRCLL